MPVINQHINIPKSVSTKDDLDFEYLRKVGVGYIEKLGGSLWTDFNSHDPGITMLEMLCYAITDLGMRINLPTQDLLANKNQSKNIDKQFYKATEVLPISSVTAIDYRKLFIDIDGVKNCWLTKHSKTVYVNCKDDKMTYKESDFDSIPEKFKKEFILKGLYDIYIDYDTSDKSKIDDINKVIRDTYHKNRNLCEDLVKIKKIAPLPIKVCADIEIENTADEELIHALLVQSVEAYFSPEVNFYSLKQMLEKGYTSLEIFDGPTLKNGFIDTTELAEANLRSEVRLSDLIKLIMAIPGVKNIKDISLGNCGEETTNENNWLMCLQEYQKPVLCDKSVFNYNKGVLPVSINKRKVAQYLIEFKEVKEEAKVEASLDKELAIPSGKSFDTDNYITIQNDFPDTYGISELGLTTRATTERKVKAKQLKGYLLFFDQILSSYFKHLSQVSELLSVSGKHTNTYFTQAINDISDLEQIVKEYPTNDDEELHKKLFGDQDNNIHRRNQILDHLLARFAEKFTEYTFIMKAIYGNATDEVVLRNKEDFLKDYKLVSTNRGKAFNYYNQDSKNLWDTDNISGIQKRIGRLLGIKNSKRRFLSGSSVQTYKLINSDNEKVYRWRLKDHQGKIILSGTTEYYDLSSANRELRFAILQIIQTDEKKVEKIFEGEIEDHFEIDNIQVHKSDSGKYSYDIINPEIENENNKLRIIAKRYNYYKSKEKLKQSILDLIQFLKEEFTEEGIFLVEHIMLRPNVKLNDSSKETFLPICTDGCTNCDPIDPYSFQVSIVIPGYTLRFSNPDFRNYMERIIKEELPAHVLAKICWVGYRDNEIDNPKENELLQFEQSYKKYLLEKTKRIHKQSQEQPQNKLKELIDNLSNLSNIYPTGRLYDCGNEEEELSGKIVLGKTNLGSL